MIAVDVLYTICGFALGCVVMYRISESMLKHYKTKWQKAEHACQIKGTDLGSLKKHHATVTEAQAKIIAELRTRVAIAEAKLIAANNKNSKKPTPRPRARK